MSWRRFKLLTKCLHLTSPPSYIDDPLLPGYDKMRQVRPVMDIVRLNFMSAWQLGPFLTIDEMMIRYKGSYCPARLYMPKKP